MMRLMPIFLLGADEALRFELFGIGTLLRGVRDGVDVGPHRLCEENTEMV